MDNQTENSGYSQNYLRNWSDQALIIREIQTELLQITQLQYKKKKFYINKTILFVH